MCNGCYKVFQMDDVLKNGYYQSPLGYGIIDWFVVEAIKLEIKLVFYFENTNEDILMS